MIFGSQKPLVTLVGYAFHHKFGACSPSRLFNFRCHQSDEIDDKVSEEIVNKERRKHYPHLVNNKRAKIPFRPLYFEPISSFVSTFLNSYFGFWIFEIVFNVIPTIILLMKITYTAHGVHSWYIKCQSGY